jgi:hypothetical protein
MKIEITRKSLIYCLAIVVGITISTLIGYFIGYDRGVTSMENPKGNGNHFYSEIVEDSGVNDHILKYYKVIYHSTLDCQHITNGIEMDGYGYVSSGKSPLPYYFCPACMSDVLIELCDNRVREAFEKN